MRLAGYAAGLLLAAPALAQTDPNIVYQEDPDIVVTGDGLHPPPGDAAYAVVTLGVNGTASNRLDDVLRDVAGLAQFRRSDSRSSHPTAQGITLRGLGGNASSRVLLLLDGVPQADPFGGWIAFPALPPVAFESVRVTRGGGSGYAGAGALAGTIELDTAWRPPATAAIAYGSRNSIDASFVGSTGSSHGFVTLSGQYARGDGFVPVIAAQRGPADRAAPYEQASVALRGAVDIGRIELQPSLSAFRDRRDRGLVFTGVRSDGVDASVRLVGFQWSALAYVQTRQFASGFASVDAARTSATPTLDQYSVPATGIGGRFEIERSLRSRANFRLGADVRAVSGRTQELFSYTAGLPTRRREAGGRSLTLGAFADISYMRGDLTLSAGGRLDRWQIGGGHLLETPLAGGPVLTDLVFADRGGWEGSGRIGAALKPAYGLTLRTAAYRGWRMPTLNELYRPFRVGADATGANPLLAPERLTGVEAGLNFQPGGIDLTMTGYWNRIEGAIANVTLANGPGTFPGVGFVSAAGVYRQRRNLDAVEARGVEIDLSLPVGPLNFQGSYAFTDARVRGSGAAAALDGLHPAQTARHQGSVTLGWQRFGARVALTARYVAPQFEDDQNQRLLAEAFTLDGIARIPVIGAFGIELRGENLFDARVEAGISGPGIIERASPRTLWIGVSYAPRR